MQFKVPQNIDLEDKIVGPLTLIQFLYLLGGGVFVYLLYMASPGTLIFWVLSIPVAAISLTLAFIKIQDQPVSHFIKAGLLFWGRPKIRIWQRQGAAIAILKHAPIKKEKIILPKKKIEKSELEKLAQIMDTGTTGYVEK